jgi:hypothetical protein
MAYNESRDVVDVTIPFQFQGDLDAVYCGKWVLTPRISGPDKYRRVVLGVRIWGVWLFYGGVSYI